mmetsp:Transcript_126184/g.365196  ORF Transcript_126184/g.365196 Transcript_126184/m.365196 type:complete len:285 (+) Transcript_126184:184-1038(+)|eukprot:CAMPEP_0176141136 /NCGR_PEP_ID=MMETSP0120_2-20121206/71760_1 /TAXON_ID=160619 /ORGANISM="Kryptoperidinium foliaceum, Strain CCMP 1326" /LENGTH=284 /DNA_ID=CAMNT_0017477253 /DNA_START=176 /DNA_END=1030 /DNA_ORIENTATION=+
MSSMNLMGQVDEGLDEMWEQSVQGINNIDPATENWKIQTLPLARIKKIMKSEEVILNELEKEKVQKALDEGADPSDIVRPNLKFMISGEAPVLMSKACELLIKDISFRAWRHTERNRRRTLQRQDLHAAVGESEVYDFLIDIVPRVSSPRSNAIDAAVATAAAMTPPPLPPGMPMAGIPGSLPNVAPPMNQPPGVGQPMPGMEHNMMQQMQHQHQPQQQPPQHHAPPAMMQYDPNQNYQYMGMPPAAPAADMSQNTNQQQQPQQQQVPQWTTHAVPDNGATQAS